MDYLLQIIFQNIQPIQDKNVFLGISYDAWFTGLTPVVLFIIGYAINKTYANHKEKKRLKDLEIYFKSLIKLLEKPLNRQKEEFIKFSHVLKEKKDQHLILNEITGFHVEQLREIDNKDLYTIFIKNKKGNIAIKTELYGKLRGSIDHINSIVNGKQKDFDILMQNFTRYQDEYSENIEITDEAFRSMAAQSKLKDKDLFLVGVRKIISEWASSKNGNVNFNDRYVAREKYINPMLELCKQYYNDPRAIYIGNYIKRCIYALDNNDELKKVYRRHYLLEAKGLQKSWFNINEILKDFDSIKSTSVLKTIIMNIPVFIKIILSILFLLCLLHLPYGYYQFVRFAGMLGFALLAWFSFQQNKNTGTIIYIALALLFQPFIKIALGRTIWNIVDVVVSLGLIISIFMAKKTSE